MYLTYFSIQDIFVPVHDFMNVYSIIIRINPCNSISKLVFVRCFAHSSLHGLPVQLILKGICLIINDFS